MASTVKVISARLFMADTVLSTVMQVTHSVLSPRQPLTWICPAVQGALGEGIGSNGHQAEQESTQHLLQGQLLLPLCALVIV